MSAADRADLSDFLKTYFPFLVVELAGCRIEGDRDLLARLIAGGFDGLENQVQWLPRLDFRLGANPPSSPTAVA